MSGISARDATEVAIWQQELARGQMTPQQQAFAWHRVNVIMDAQRPPKRRWWRFW